MLKGRLCLSICIVNFLIWQSFSLNACILLSSPRAPQRGRATFIIRVWPISFVFFSLLLKLNIKKVSCLWSFCSYHLCAKLLQIAIINSFWTAARIIILGLKRVTTLLLSLQFKSRVTIIISRHKLGICLPMQPTAIWQIFINLSCFLLIIIALFKRFRIRCCRIMI